MSSKGKTKKTFADQILALTTPKPVDIDPEADFGDNKWKPDEDDFEDDAPEILQPPKKKSVGKSLRDISLSEGKYAGKAVSRKAFQEDANVHDFSSENDENVGDIESDQEVKKPVTKSSAVKKSKTSQSNGVTNKKSKKISQFDDDSEEEAPKSDIGRRIANAFKMLEDDSDEGEESEEADEQDMSDEQEEEEDEEGEEEIDEGGQQLFSDDEVMEEDFGFEDDGDDGEVHMDEEAMQGSEDDGSNQTGGLLKSKAMEEANLLAKQLEEEQKQEIKTIQTARPSDEGEKALHTKKSENSMEQSSR